MDKDGTILMSLFDVTKLYTIFSIALPTGYLFRDEYYYFWEIIYVEYGEMIIKIQNEEYRISNSQMIVLPPNIPHKGRLLSKTCYEHIISFESASESMMALEKKVFTLDKKECAAIIEMVRNGTEMFSWLDAKAAVPSMCMNEAANPIGLFKLKLQIEEFLCSLYSKCYEINGIVGVHLMANQMKQKRMFTEICDYLHDNVRKNLTIGEIARSLCISESALKKIFRKEAGKGVIDYFIDLKIRKALELIREGRMTFGEIADYLGFSTQMYFSRIFKKRMNMSPTEYSVFHGIQVQINNSIEDNEQ